MKQTFFSSLLIPDLLIKGYKVCRNINVYGHTNTENNMHFNPEQISTNAAKTHPALAVTV